MQLVSAKCYFTYTLLQLCFTSVFRTRKQLWLKLTELINKFCCNMSANKWKSLDRSYKKTKKKNNSSGRPPASCEHEKLKLFIELFNGFGFPHTPRHLGTSFTISFVNHLTFTQGACSDSRKRAQHKFEGAPGAWEIDSRRREPSVSENFIV